MSEPNASAPTTELPISFGAFLISLGRTALEHIGDPEKSDERTDLDMARQTIDLLGILQIKTKGNLDQEEEKLLESMLAELRVRYSEKRRRMGR